MTKCSSKHACNLLSLTPSGKFTDYSRHDQVVSIFLLFFIFFFFFFFFFFFLESALFSVDSYVLLFIVMNNLVAGDSQDQPYSNNPSIYGTG